MKYLKAPAEVRFWRFVDKTDGCWLWTGTTTSEGYGRFWNKRLVLSHRWMWEHVNGPIPDGLRVLHNCPNGDDPRCVRPDHLWLGTESDNARDREKKGRGNHPTGARSGSHTHPESRQWGDKNWTRQRPEDVLRGEANGSSKLTTEAVKEIRIRAAAGETQISIARRFGVIQPHISRIVRREVWAHI